MDFCSIVFELHHKRIKAFCIFVRSIRGRLAAITLLARNIGLLLGYVLFATVKYEHIPIIGSSIFIIFFILFVWQPNTPRYYIRKGQFKVAILICNFEKSS